MHPPLLSSIHLHPPPSSSFQPPPSSLQHPQQYLNQNNARNCAISPNLGQKIKSCPIWLKIGIHGILEVLIPNPDLEFWNSDTQVHFWANIGSKIQSCLFCLKIGSHSISRMPIPNPELDFWNFDPKIHFWANLGPKSQSYRFCLEIGTHGISRMLILIPILFQILISLLGKFGPKKSKLSVLTENWHTWYLGSADSESGLWFLKFWPQNSFLGKFGLKKSKLFVLPENWHTHIHTQYLQDVDCYFDISFLKFQT